VGNIDTIQAPLLNFIQVFLGVLRYRATFAQVVVVVQQSKISSVIPGPDFALAAVGATVLIDIRAVIVIAVHLISVVGPKLDPSPMTQLGLGKTLCCNVVVWLQAMVNAERDTGYCNWRCAPTVFEVSWLLALPSDAQLLEVLQIEGLSSI
jgi:hypothetical protein